MTMDNDHEDNYDDDGVGDSDTENGAKLELFLPIFDESGFLTLHYMRPKCLQGGYRLGMRSHCGQNVQVGLGGQLTNVYLYISHHSKKFQAQVHNGYIIHGIIKRSTHKARNQQRPL